MCITISQKFLIILFLCLHITEAHTDILNLRRQSTYAEFLESLLNSNGILCSIVVIHSAETRLFGHENVYITEKTQSEIKISGVLEIQLPIYRTVKNETLFQNALSYIDTHQKRKKCTFGIILVNEFSDATSNQLHDVTKKLSEVIKKNVDYFLLISEEPFLNQILLSRPLGAGIKNKLALGKDKNGELVVKSACHYCKSGNPMIINLHMKENACKSLQYFFPDYLQLETFQGKILKVTTPILARWFVELQKKNGRWELKRGINVQIIQHLKHRYNFSTEFFPSSGGGGTGAKVNGNWSGSIGDIYYGRADISTTVGQTIQRNEVVGFSTPFGYAKLTFVVSKPKRFYTWKSIYLPLAFNVWIPFVISIFIAILTVEFLFRAARQNVSRIKILKYIFETLTEQDTGRLILHPSNALRFFMACWLFFGIVIATAYRSKLMNFLMFPNLTIIPNTFEELADSNYHLVLQYIKGLGLDRLKVSNNPSHQKIVKQLELQTDDVECFKSVIKTHSSCIAWYDVVDYIANQNISDKFGRVPFVRAPVSIFFIPCGIIMEKMAIFLPNFNNVIIQAVDMGLFIKWFNMDAEFIHIERRRWETITNTPEVNYDEGITNVITLKHLIGSFYLLFIGLSFSTCFYVLETLIYKKASLKIFT